MTDRGGRQVVDGVDRVDGVDGVDGVAGRCLDGTRTRWQPLRPRILLRQGFGGQERGSAPRVAIPICVNLR
jgi:hypothetical protein